MKERIKMALLNYEQRISKYDIQYGIENEFTGLTREKSAKLLSQYFGCNYIHTHEHGLDCYKLFNGYKIMSDSSVSAHPESNELVTPVMSINDIEKLLGALKLLSDNGAYTDKTCGLHVHVSNEHMYEVATVKKLLQHDFTRYDMVYLATRGFKRWSQPQDETFVRKVSKMSSRSAIEKLWYETYSDGCRDHYNSSRYHGLNLHSMYEGKGVEFRYFSGTFDLKKVKAYIELSIGMLMDAVNSYKMRQYIYVDRPYNKVYDRNNRSEYRSIADCTYIPERILYKYSTLWSEYLDRMQISYESKKVLLENF